MIRSAEKSRRATCAIADNIATISIDFYRRLISEPSILIDYKQTVMAAILARNSLGEFCVVSMGVGTKYISHPDNVSDYNCIRIKDSHAEVLAMRGFRLYLLDEIRKSIKGESEIFIFNDSCAKLIPGISFHMYTSSQPCGNACITRWAKGGVGPEHPDLDVNSFPPDSHPPLNPPSLHQGQVSILFKKPRFTDENFENDDTPPQSDVINKPSVCSIDGQECSFTSGLKEFDYASVPKSCSNVCRVKCNNKIEYSGYLLTCSDKIMQRNILGYQGKWLFGFGLTGRIHIDTLTVGRKFKFKAAQRAVCCRVGSLLKEGDMEENEEGDKDGGRKRRKMKKGADSLPCPFGIQHMLIMGTKIKMDTSTYTIENKADGMNENEDETDACFKETKCIIWAKIKYNSSKGGESESEYINSLELDDGEFSKNAGILDGLIPFASGIASILDGTKGFCLKRDQIGCHKENDDNSRLTSLLTCSENIVLPTNEMAHPLINGVESTKYSNFCESIFSPRSMKHLAIVTLQAFLKRNLQIDVNENCLTKFPYSELCSMFGENISFYSKAKNQMRQNGLPFIYC